MIIATVEQLLYLEQKTTNISWKNQTKQEKLYFLTITHFVQQLFQKCYINEVIAIVVVIILIIIYQVYAIYRCIKQSALDENK